MLNAYIGFSTKGEIFYLEGLINISDKMRQCNLLSHMHIYIYVRTVVEMPNVIMRHETFVNAQLQRFLNNRRLLHKCKYRVFSRLHVS